jgi:hypothetical protein
MSATWITSKNAPRSTVCKPWEPMRSRNGRLWTTTMNSALCTLRRKDTQAVRTSRFPTSTHGSANKKRTQHYANSRTLATSRPAKVSYGQGVGRSASRHHEYRKSCNTCMTIPFPDTSEQRRLPSVYKRGSGGPPGGRTSRNM